MKCLVSTFLGAAVAAPLLALSTPVRAGVGDLLVAPTRIVLDGRKGAEVILNNIGEEPATYRVSVEFRRMTEDGGLIDVAEPSAEDKLAQDMIVYAPRRVTLAPHQPQSIRPARRKACRTANIVFTCCFAPFRRRPLSRLRQQARMTRPGACISS
jgi:P pilus assembly chaperone PapD